MQNDKNTSPAEAAGELAMRESCYGCHSREVGCHSRCPCYARQAERSAKIRAARRADREADEAGALRGDKIRRDAHRYGIHGKRR